MKDKLPLGPIRLREQRRRSAVPVKLNKESNPWDKAVIEMAKRRFAVAAIMAHTGLTESQVRHRIDEFNCGLMRHRKGLSPEARMELAEIDSTLGAAKALRARIRSILGHAPERRQRVAS
jgi:hypothetical protein